MLPANLDDTTESDLSSLIDSGVEEGFDWDFKSNLNIDDRKEFIADVSSFANARGGTLIFGCEEAEKRPVAFPGLDVPDRDKLGQQIDNVLRDNLDPHLPMAEHRFVPVQGGSRFVLVLRVGRSWIGPHRSRVDRHFYARNSSGKFQLDVHALRDAFVRASEADSKIREFRVERVGKIVAGETPVDLESRRLLVIHVIPYPSFLADRPLLDTRRDYQALFKFEPINRVGWNSQINVDGFLTYSGNESSTAFTYVQVFRNLAVEAVVAIPCLSERTLHGDSLEQFTLEAASRIPAHVLALGGSMPMFFSASWLGVQGCNWRRSASVFPGDRALRQEHLHFRGNVLETPGDPAEIAGAVLDQMWNAFGLNRPRS